MNIRELRKAYNLSQAALAEKLGVTAKTISRLENGQMMISDQIADRIWDVFGVEIAGGEEKKPVKKVKAPKLEIYIQSPLGGNITPEEVAARMPEGTEACFVRVDQNLIWWVRGEETGAVEIWSDDRSNAEDGKSRGERSPRLCIVCGISSVGDTGHEALERPVLQFDGALKDVVLRVGDHEDPVPVVFGVVVVGEVEEQVFLGTGEEVDRAGLVLDDGQHGAEHLPDLHHQGAVAAFSLGVQPFFDGHKFPPVRKRGGAGRQKDDRDQKRDDPFHFHASFFFCCPHYTLNRGKRATAPGWKNRAGYAIIQLRKA